MHVYMYRSVHAPIYIYACDYLHEYIHVNIVPYTHDLYGRGDGGGAGAGAGDGACGEGAGGARAGDSWRRCW